MTCGCHVRDTLKARTMNTRRYEIVYCPLHDQARQLKAQTDEDAKRILTLILERDRWQSRAEARWALRKEFEALVDYPDGATYDEAVFQAVLERVRGWKRALEQIAAPQFGGTPAGYAQKLAQTAKKALTVKATRP